MKVPQTFIPEKDLTDRVNNYLNNDKYSGENNMLHRDPNLNLTLCTLGIVLKLEGKSSREIEQCILKSFQQFEGDRCVYVIDFLKTAENYLPEDINHKMSEHLKGTYAKKIKLDIVNSYLDEKLSIQNSVMNYVNMIIGLGSENLGPNKTWIYSDPKTKIPILIKIDTNYINAVENRLGLKSIENKETFRRTIMKVYAAKVSSDPCYDFMGHIGLVEAVTDVKLDSELSKAGSLIGSLASRTNEENKRVYNKIINNMINHHGYCELCAEKTLESFESRKL